MKRPLDKTNKNDVLYDNIDVMDTINYTNRYRFYNAIEEMISQKIRMAAALRANGNIANMPIIRINLACPDEKPYPKQSERFFLLMKWAAKHGIVLETTRKQKNMKLCRARLLFHRMTHWQKTCAISSF